MVSIFYLCEGGLVLLNESFETLVVSRFDRGSSAESYLKLKRGEVISELENIFSKISSLNIKEIVSQEIQLKEAFMQRGLDLQAAGEELQDQLMSKKIQVMLKSGFIRSEDEARELVRDFALQFSRLKLKELSAKLDLQAIEAIQALDEVDKMLNLLSSRAREWYGLHFPELSSLIDESETYCKLVTRFGRREDFIEDDLHKFGFSDKKVEAILTASESSKGGELRDEDLRRIVSICEEALHLYSLRDKLVKHLESSMKEIAPNLTNIVGATIGARLLSKAGGLEKLARLPSSTIQILGAERALFRALKTGSNPPKHGILFQHQAVHSAPRWQRGKIARSLANKIAIAARVDAFRGSFDDEVKEKLDIRLEEIRHKYGEPPKKRVEPRRVRKKKKRGRVERRKRQS